MQSPTWAHWSSPSRNGDTNRRSMWALALVTLATVTTGQNPKQNAFDTPSDKSENFIAEMLKPYKAVKPQAKPLKPSEAFTSKPLLEEPK